MYYLKNWAKTIKKRENSDYELVFKCLIMEKEGAQAMVCSISVCPSFLQWHKLAGVFYSHGIKLLADMDQSTPIADGQIYVWNKKTQLSSWSQVDYICRGVNFNSWRYLMQISGRFDLFQVLLNSLNHCWVVSTEFSKWEAMGRVAWSDIVKINPWRCWLC